MNNQCMHETTQLSCSEKPNQGMDRIWHQHKPDALSVCPGHPVQMQTGTVQPLVAGATLVGYRQPGPPALGPSWLAADAPASC